MRHWEPFEEDASPAFATLPPRALARAVCVTSNDCRTPESRIAAPGSCNSQHTKRRVSEQRGISGLRYCSKSIPHPENGRPAPRPPAGPPFNSLHTRYTCGRHGFVDEPDFIRVYCWRHTIIPGYYSLNASRTLPPFGPFHSGLPDPPASPSHCPKPTQKLQVLDLRAMHWYMLLPIIKYP